MHEVYLLLGSNKGDRLGLLLKAIQRITDVSSQEVLVSPVYESEPWGFDTETWFLNLAVKLYTVLSPEDLLSQILEIEKDLGRKRIDGSVGYESREIDIDIIFYSDKILDTFDLKVPHPKMDNRRFVLLPLSRLAPFFVHPVHKKTVNELLEMCKDNSEVREFSLM